MYLKKQNKDNLEGSIAWLEQTINDGIDPKLNPEIVLNFLKEGSSYLSISYHIVFGETTIKSSSNSFKYLKSLSHKTLSNIVIMLPKQQ